MPGFAGGTPTEKEKNHGAEAELAHARCADPVLDQKWHSLRHFPDCRAGSHELGSSSRGHHDGPVCLALLLPVADQPRGARRPARVACRGGGHSLSVFPLSRAHSRRAASFELCRDEYRHFHLALCLRPSGLQNAWRNHANEYIDDGPRRYHGTQRPGAGLLPIHRGCFLWRFDRRDHRRPLSTHALAAFAATRNARVLPGVATPPARRPRVWRADAGGLAAPSSSARRNPPAPCQYGPPGLPGGRDPEPPHPSGSSGPFHRKPHLGIRSLRGGQCQHADAKNPRRSL